MNIASSRDGRIAVPLSHIEDARAVLADCSRHNPDSGMPYPYFCPGVCPSGTGDYGNNWWSLDYALAAEGAMLYDARAGEELILNLLAVQKPDGRVPLYSIDSFPADWTNIVRPIGSLPKFFEAAHMAACQNPSLRKKAFDLISRNLAWWYNNRFDEKTGLFSAVFEETFIPNTVSDAGVYAPMDTNVELYLGCRAAADLAPDENTAAAFRSRADAILCAVRAHCYDETDGFFYPFVIPRGERYKVRMASGFLGYYLNDPAVTARLNAHLTDDAEFGWDTVPLTGVAKDDPLFTVTTGDYTGNPSWEGSVWMLINDAVIRALRAADQNALADQLTAKTLAAFGKNCAEFLDPFTGKGNGMLRYAWTAGLFLHLAQEINP